MAESSQSFRRAFLIMTAIAVAAPLLTAALTWNRLVGAVLIRALESQGLGPARLIVHRMTTDRLDIVNLQLGQGEVKADRVMLVFRAADIWRGQMARAVVTGLRIEGRMDAQGLSFGALDGARGGEGGGLPLRQVVFENGSLALAGAAGRTQMDFDGTLDATADTLALNAQLRLGGSEAGGRTAPLNLTVTAHPKSDGTAFAARLTDADNKASLSLAGQQRRDGQGTAKLDLTPVDLAADPIGLRLVFPTLARIMVAPSGALAGRGTLAWSKRGLNPHLELMFQNVGFTAADMVVDGLHGVLTLDRLNPLATPPDQHLAAARIVAGLPLTDVDMTFRLDGKGIAIASASARLLGGKVTAEPSHLRFDGNDGRIALKIDDLALADAARLAEVEGLDAQGAMDGQAVLVMKNGALAVEEARLTAPARGRLAYRPAQPPAALADQPGGIGLLMQALADFHFSALDVALSGPLAGDLAARLTLAGGNPKLGGGQPIEINLSVTGPLARIAEASLHAQRIPDKIMERLSAFGKGEPER